MVKSTRDQHSEQSEPSWWPRAERVKIVNGCIEATLSEEGQTFTALFSQEPPPHVDFLAVADADNDGMVYFMKRWGPLWLTEDEKASGRILATTMAAYTLEQYWAFHRLLKSLVKLLSAFKQEQGEREALAEFLKAKAELFRVRIPFDLCDWKTNTAWSPTEAGIVVESLRLESRQFAEVMDGIKKAPVRNVRRAIQRIIEWSEVARAGQRVSREGGVWRIRPFWWPETLQEALEAFVWMSEWGKRPLTYCPECGRLFQPTSARFQKYCRGECEHRVTAREWIRRKRKEVKARAKRKRRKRP